MGLFNFLGKVGEKLFQPGDAKKGEAIRKHLKDLGLPDVEVDVDGDKVILSGQVASQELREKIILAAGNVEGITSVSDDRLQAPAAPAESPVFYEVVSGDTLSKISQKHYGDPNKYSVIFEANKPMLKHPDKIYPGQRLRIPKL
jgi:nucleoid-associated protein YgaU